MMLCSVSPSPALSSRTLLLSVALSALVVSACVSTQSVDRRSPDPRGGEKKLARTAPRLDLKLVTDLVPSDPLINVRAVFLTGSADDPAGKEGLTQLTATLMREATTDLDASALNDTLFPWAAELSVHVDKDTTVFVGRVHKDHAQAFSDLFLDVLLRPRLDDGDFARLRTDQRASIEQALRGNDDEALQREALEVLLYDPIGTGAFPTPPLGPNVDVTRHIYRHTPRGTVQGLASLTPADVQAHRRAVFTRDRLVLGVSGGADNTFVEKLTKALRALPESQGTRRMPTPPPLPQQNLALVVEKPAAGTAISLGFVLPELDRAHPDYAALKLAETYFGEHRNLIGHLFSSMREKRGLNYGDYAYIEHFVQEGWSSSEKLNITRRQQYFSMWIRPVEHKNRFFALRQAVYELDRFAKNGIPTDEAFQNVQSFVQGYWRAKEQEPMRRLGYRIDEVITGQPFDRDGLRARVKALTRADVNDAIRRHLRGDRLSIVVVTDDGESFKQTAVSGVPTPITYLAPRDAAVLAEDKVIEAFPLGLSQQGVRIIKPDALFER
jgi:zinc protease